VLKAWGLGVRGYRISGSGVGVCGMGSRVKC